MPTTPATSKSHLSLLDDSPMMPEGGEQSHGDNSRVSSPPKPCSNEDLLQGQYDSILEQGSKWKSQMEGVRDELLLLQIKNAILLDDLTMAGADV
jgi:hypothetical protein